MLEETTAVTGEPPAEPTVAAEATAEPSAPEFTDEDFAAVYRAAEERGISEEQLSRMRDTDLLALIGKGQTPPQQEATPEQQTAQTTDTATEAAPVEAQVQTPTKDTPAPPPNDGLQSRYDNLKDLYGKQSNELGQLRQAMTQFRPFIEQLADPNFSRHVMGYFDGGRTQTPAPTQTQTQGQEVDPFNPATIENLVNQRVEQALTAKERAQREFAIRQQNIARLTTFQTGYEAGIQRVSAETGKPVEEVRRAANDLTNKLIAGQDIADIAFKISNFDTMIAEAEMRGEANAIKRLQSAQQKAVPRTAGAQVAQTTSKKSGDTFDMTNATEAEVIERLRSLKAFSPEWENLDRFGRERFGWQ